MRFIHRSGSAALTQQDRLRKCSLTIVAARTALTRTTQQTGQHHDQQQPESSGQKLYVPGVDRGSPKELLGRTLANLKDVALGVTGIANHEPRPLPLLRKDLTAKGLR